MKKRVLSMFMALALCLTLLPTAALADELGPVDGTSTVETAGADAEAEAKAKAGAEAVAAVQAMIGELPSLGELKGMDSDTLNEAYMAVQSAYDAYEALSEEQQAQVTGADRFEGLFGWFNSQVAVLEDSGNIYPDVVDADGGITAGTTFNRNGPIVEDSNDSTTFCSNQYYVVKESSNVTINGDLIIDSCTNNGLILCKGATLTVTGALIHKGGTFPIYGVSDSGNNAGRLVIENSKGGGAAIRPSENGAPTLSIYSGELEIHGNGQKLIDGVKLYSKNKVHTAALDKKQVLLAAWSDVSSIKGTSLVLTYCEHSVNEQQQYIADADGTDGSHMHHLYCTACGFTWPSEAYKLVPLAYDEETHTMGCDVCENYKLKPDGHSYENALNPVPTDDGKGHTGKVCSVCGAAGGESSPHTYGADGRCKDCEFKPAFEDSKGNLYEYNGSDSIDALNEAIKKGETSFKLVNFARGEGADAATVEAAFALETDANVTLNMNGYTLENGGAPVITVEAGTLNITGAAVISQAAKSKELVAPAIKVTGGALTFDNVVTATGSAADSSAAPAILIGGGTVAFEQDVTATAVENAGLYTAIAPAIKVTGGKAVFNGKVTATGGLGGVSQNTRLCEPAIKATGGELDFNGDLDLNGGLTITGDAKLTKGLTRGTFKVDYGETVTKPRVSVEGSSVYSNLYSLLGTGRGFADRATNEIESRAMLDSQKSWAGDVTIVEHTHSYKNKGYYHECDCGRSGNHSFDKSGACSVCGKPCDHTADRANTNGHWYCDNCGAQVYAYIQNGYIFDFYTTLKDALAAAENGQTVKLVDDIDNSNQTACLTGDGKTVTLNLNGHTINEGWIYVGIDQDGTVINSSRLNITGSGSFDGMIGISAKGTLDLSAWDGGTIRTVSSSQNGSDESTLISGENKGTINTLSFSSWPSDKISKTKLTGGTYGSIPISMNSGVTSISFSDLLAPGYAFQYADGSGSFVNYATKATYDAGGVIYNVKVVKCTTHVDAKRVDADGNITDGADNLCDYCNTDLEADAVATLTVDGSTYFYTDLPSALKAASSKGGTVTLQKDVENVSQMLVIEGSLHVTLDLNGKKITGDGSSTLLGISNLSDVTICDSSESKAGQIKCTASGYAVYVSEGCDLTISGGTFEGTDGATTSAPGYAVGVDGAKLIITGGTFNGAVTINARGATITGGTFNGAFSMSAQPDVFSGGTFTQQAVFSSVSNILTGGEFRKGIKSTDKRLYELLAENKAYQTADDWLDDNTTYFYNDTGSSVTVVEAPIHSVTLTVNGTSVELDEANKGRFSVELGTAVTLTASCEGSMEAPYGTWYPTLGGEEDGSTGSPVKRDTGKSLSYTLPPEDLTVGTHTYRVSFCSKDPGKVGLVTGYYKGAQITITVTPRDLKNATVEYYTTNNPTVVTYNPLNNHICGLLIYKVTLDGVKLEDGTDYIISGNTAAEVGKYTAILTAKPGSTKCKGTLKIEWEVVPYALPAPAFEGRQTYTKTYDGTTFLPEGYKFQALFLAQELGSSEVDWRGDEFTDNYEVTAAEFVSPDAGENKPINQTITLKNENFVFAPTEDIKIVGITTTDKTITYKNFTLSEAYPTLGTTFNIKKATVPDFDKAVTLEVINDLENTYTIDLPALPALESPKTYGDITYTVASQSLEHGYATLGQPTVKQVDGKYQLCLTVPAVKYDQETSIGTILVKVTTTNYNDVVLTVNLQSVNKRKLGMFVSVATDPVVYGMTLGDIKLSAQATDGGQVIPGTIAWEDPLTTVPAAGRATYRWTFTPDDTMHYLTASNTIHFSVDKATPTGAPTYTAITAGGKTLADAALTANASWPSGTVQWVDKDGKPLPASTQVQANTEYTWSFTPADADNYNGATGSVTLYAVTSGGGSSSGGGGSSSAGKTTTTTTAKDGSVTRIETKPDGSSVTQRTLADGSTGTVKTDKNGQTTAETTLSSKAIEDAKKSGEPVKAPVEVKASRDSSTAPTVKVELPRNSGETKVEIPVTNVKPGTVAVLVHPDGTEEILKASVPTENGIRLTVDGNATVKIVDNSKDFVDTRNHWAREEIDFVSARELVNGISATRYAPDATATRAQLWTILARQNDTDLSGGANWYEKAQLWSKDKGISDGTNPNGTINRAQMVTMLWRTMGQPAAGGSASFADVPADSYYAQAVAWAIENGITAGVGDGRFDPNSTCTRAQIATFLARSMK